MALPIAIFARLNSDSAGAGQFSFGENGEEGGEREKESGSDAREERVKGARGGNGFQKSPSVIPTCLANCSRTPPKHIKVTIKFTRGSKTLQYGCINFRV